MCIYDKYDDFTIHRIQFLFFMLESKNFLLNFILIFIIFNIFLLSAIAISVFSAINLITSKVTMIKIFHFDMMG